MGSEHSLPKLRRTLIEPAGSFPAVHIGSPARHPERVLQFGEGNFLRAFVDWQFQELIDAGKFNGSIVVVQPLPKGMVGMVNAQDGLYTVVQRGIQDGAVVERPHLITAISRGIDPYTHYAEYLQCAANPEMRYIISNTTESGIEYVKCERPKEICPASYPAKVTSFLFERFTVFGGDVSKGMIIIPCELIEQNGDTLKKCVLQHAVDWGCDNCIRLARRRNDLLQYTGGPHRPRLPEGGSGGTVRSVRLSGRSDRGVRGVPQMGHPGECRSTEGTAVRNRRAQRRLDG